MKELKLIIIFLLVILNLNLKSESINREAYLSKLFSFALNKYHYSKMPIDDEMSKKAMSLYLEILDYNKRYFTKEQIKELNKYKTSIDDQLLSGSMEFFKLSDKIFEENLNKIKEYIKEICKNKFDFSKDENLVLLPEEKDYPANEEEFKERWRKYIKYRTLLKIHILKKEDKNKKVKIDNLIKEASESVKKNMLSLMNRISRRNYEEKSALYFNAILRTADPHTSYFSPKATKDFEIDMSGTVEGIGALLTEEDGYIKIVSIVPGGPAWKSKKIDAGDLIMKVETPKKGVIDLEGMPVSDSVQFIRGKKGSKLILTLKKNDGRIINVSLVRDIVENKESFVRIAILKNKKNKKEKFAYISIPSFYNDFSRRNGRNCSDDLKKLLKEMSDYDIKGAVIDLRNNGGGCLPDAVQISGFFIEEGPIVQIKDTQDEVEVLKDKDEEIFYKGPLIILVNQLSASASEILTAALRDYKRALIVGCKTTFGKGTVQAYLNLNKFTNDPLLYNKMGSLKITIKKFYGIKGESNQYKGITPDIELPGLYDNVEVGEKFYDYALKSDTWKALDIKTFPNGIEDSMIQKLKVKSSQRVLNNEYFNSLKKYMKNSEQIKKKKTITLNYKKFQEQQKQIEELLEKVNKTLDDKGQFKVIKTLTNTKKKTKNSRLKKIEKKIYKEWVEGIEGDKTIEECLFLLQDMVS